MLKLNCVIFYFSQQGSTQKIAQAIAEGLTSKRSRCELVRFTKLAQDLVLVNRFDFKNYDLIGIGTPVYYFYPPHHLFEVFETFPQLENKRAFLFSTSGGNPGAALFKIK